MVNKVFGIDLGTTYSCIAYVDEHGKAVVVPNAESLPVTPSVVFFDGDQIIVGKVAKENSKIYPDDVVEMIKRSMGDSNFMYEHKGKTYKPEEISSFILRKLVVDAEQKLGEKIDDVVITCPAYFGINEREATRLAGEIAGLKVRQIINEPTAAAITYGSLDTRDEKVVLVYDLGGGTFDVTMISIKNESIDVICTGGAKELGGKDWDDTLVQYLVDCFREQTGKDDDILADSDTYQDIRLSAESAKQTLSTREKTAVSVTYGGERAKIEITREKFDELTQALLERTISLTHDMLGEAKKKGFTKYDEILLVGGSTRMPQIAKRVASEFSMEPKLFDPDEAVAKGAALFGWKLSLNDELITRIADATGKSIEDVKNASPKDIPEAVLDKISQDVADDTGFTLSAVKRSKIGIRNVTSKSFGIVVFDTDKKSIVANLILKNTTVPADVTQTFGTLEDNQESVDLKIMENEVSDKTIAPELAKEIGTAILEIPPGLPKDSKIKINFRLNDEGRLEMTATEVTQSRQVDVVIETTSIIQGEELQEVKKRSKGIVVS